MTRYRSGGIGPGATYSGDVVVVGSLITDEIKDSGDNVILSSNGFGMINDLAALHADLLTQSESHIVAVTPAMICPINQSGTLNEATGEWSVVGDDSLYLYISKVLTQSVHKADVKLQLVHLYVNSSHNDAYVDKMTLQSYNLSPGTVTDVWNDPIDLGNGSTGNEVRNYTVNETLLSGLAFILKVDVKVSAGTLIVRSLKMRHQYV